MKETNKIIAVLEFELDKKNQSVESLMRVISENKIRILKASVYELKEISDG